MTRTERITDIGVRLFKALQNNVLVPLSEPPTRCARAHVSSTTATRRIRRWACRWTESDEPNRFGIQLYHRVATQADLSGKTGAGGQLRPRRRGLLPRPHVAPGLLHGSGLQPGRHRFLPRRRTDVPGLDFVHGDAENLPFADESFDAVINVEASHAYPRLSRFLAEVARVLRPGGHFLYTDFRGRQRVSRAGTQHWPTSVARRFRNESSIPSVLRGLDKNSERSLELIERPGADASAAVRPPFRRCARHRNLPRFENGTIEYRMYSLHQGLIARQAIA